MTSMIKQPDMTREGQQLTSMIKNPQYDDQFDGTFGKENKPMFV